ncbi:4a-hydroxytetrahydrobiopterin dehydratase [Burkholderiaceae bacterium UC74_6]
MMKRLSENEIALKLAGLPGWSRVGDHIERQFRFADFDTLIAFVNAVAAVAREQDHHPDVRFGYSDCTVAYTTHSADGITARDFAAAERIDKL